MLMDKNFHETTNLRVEIMNSRRQVKEKLGHVVQLNVNLMLILFNLSFVIVLLCVTAKG